MLIYYVIIIISTSMHFNIFCLNRKNKLSNVVKNYQILNYNINLNIREQRRIKRSIYSTGNPIPIIIRLCNFTLLLRPLFLRKFKNIIFEMDGEKLNNYNNNINNIFEPYTYMEGKVKLIKDSYVFGYFNRNIFVGHFRIENDNFEVELSKQYKWEKNITFHSILYNHKDLKSLNLNKTK